MDILILIIIFLLGTIIGSFLNVVIYRFNTGRKISKGRSICMSCSKTLKWFELVPILSFIFLRGKCRKCSGRISCQYPIVEFLTGLVFAFTAYHFFPVLSFSYIQFILLVTFYIFIFSLLIVISVYDIKHKIIPDSLVFLFIGIAFLSLFINPDILNGVDSRLYSSIFAWPTLMAFVTGPLLALPFVFLWLISGGRWMGLGDGKLILGIGWLLGLKFGLLALILSFWIGSIVGILILLFNRRNKFTAKTEIPFAPFLIVGMLIVFLYNIDIFTLVSYLIFNI